MQKTQQELAAEFEALIIEFDRATRGLFKPTAEQRIDDARSAKIYRLSDYRVLH